MKKKKTLQFISLQLLLMISFTSSIFATEFPCTFFEDTIQTDNHIDINKKSYLSFGLVMAHFGPTKKSQNSGYNTSIFNPGLEMLITIGLRNTIGVSTGLHYQYGLIKNTFIQERLIFGELSLPIIVSVPVVNTNKRSLNLSSGVYVGQYIHIKKESKSGKLNPGNTWQKVSLENIEGYTNDKIIADFYFGLGYQELNQRFQIDLFSTYRLNKIWLNNEISKLIFGIKINYNLKN